MSQAVIIGLISFYANVSGVNPNMAVSVAMHESSLNPKATGALGEVGLFQLRSEYVKGFTKAQLYNPTTNIIVGIQKLKEAQDTCIYRKDVQFLVCYNVGRTNAKKIKHPESFPYVKAVEELMYAQTEI